jgi:hypothetical protein
MAPPADRGGPRHAAPTRPVRLWTVVAIATVTALTLVALVAAIAVLVDCMH